MAITIQTNNIIKHDIKDENGNVLHQLRYNPSDINTLTKFWNLLEILYKNSQEMPQPNQEDLLLLNKDLQTKQDYQAAEKAVKNITATFGGVVKSFEEVAACVDAIFGEGVAQVFCQGYADVAMLEPLFEAVLPDFEKAAQLRREKLQQYTKNRKPAADKK